jgi:hypothetical protein
MLRKNVPLAAALIAASVHLVIGQEIARETSPILLREVKAQYTAEAKRKGIHGMVELEAVVLEDR